jgi:tetratricopeptide (TPR) repeat protein
VRCSLRDRLETSAGEPRRLFSKSIVVIAILVCCSAGFSQTQRSPIEEITSALRAKEFDRAVELSRSALRASPDDARLWSLQGVALASKGDTKKALTAFQQSLKISPNNVVALEGAAQIEYQFGSRDAVPLLNHLLQLRPGDLTSHAMLAVLAFQQGNCAMAIAHFEKAGAVLDSQLDALHAYATCLLRLKRFEDAANVLQRAVTVRPNDRQELHVLASVQLMAHKSQAAILTLEPLLDSKPDAETLELASAAYEDVMDTPQAVSTLRQAILLEPRNVNLYLDFANISFAHQSFQVGIDVISEGISLQPTASPLYLARGVLYVQLSEYDEAAADFERAHDLDPSQSLSTAAQGLAAAQANDLDRALATIQAKLARKPNDPLLLYLQADILGQKGAAPGTPEFRTAMRSAQRAVSLQPALGAARGVLAKLYLQAGQNQEAVQQCRKALALDPKDQTALYHLIQGLRKTGNKAEIPELLKRLALLREQAAKEEGERNRFKLIEEDTPSSPRTNP